jgi:hypothetical protein
VSKQPTPLISIACAFLTVSLLVVAAVAATPHPIATPAVPDGTCLSGRHQLGPTPKFRPWARTDSPGNVILTNAFR